jgi:hypothetical protein
MSRDSIQLTFNLRFVSDLGSFSDSDFFLHSLLASSSDQILADSSGF